MEAVPGDRAQQDSNGGDVSSCDETRCASEAAEETDATSLSVMQMSIDEVLDDLSPSHRDIIHLQIEGHEVAAIAEQLGRSKRSVERILQGFRELLAGMIRGNE